jgi:hypothetical protein
MQLKWEFLVHAKPIGQDNWIKERARLNYSLRFFTMLRKASLVSASILYILNQPAFSLAS